MQQDAKTDWDERIAVRSDEDRAFAFPELDPPKEVTAVGGVGQVTIDWSPVDGAVGYLILRGTGERGPLEPVDHHSGDVLSVPSPPYVDTTCTPGTPYRYAVASVPEVTAHGRPSHTVGAVPLVADSTSPKVDVTVDVVAEGTELQRPWEPMVGSERLSQLLCKDLTGGHEIGSELEDALRRMHDEIGVRTVRAHAVFHDDTHVIDGDSYDFSVVDAIYDKLLAIGLRPVVELGFMPRELASDPTKTVFEYGAIISPPASYQRWHDLVRALVQHLVDRYGLDEVLTWDFEVWNEANLEVFWSGTKAEWLQLYDVSAAAVKSVDPRLAVGGPSSAAAGWVDDLLVHAKRFGTPVDFVSTHTYGSPPLDVRASLGTARVRRCAHPVDRVGRDADALQPDQRLGVLRGVPAPRHAVRSGADRRALVLGRVRPLRGTRPAAAAPAWRLRPANPWWIGETALPRDDIAQPARTGRASGDVRR